MGVTTINQEFTSSVAPAKMFKALVLDSHNLIPKLVPQSIKSIEFVQGDGSVGSIKQTNFSEGGTCSVRPFTSSVAPTRMFKASVLDSHNLIPKLVPQSTKSIEIVEGDGSVGSIKQTNFPQGSHFKYLKHKIDALDADNYECKYTLIEGDVLGNAVESIAYEVKFEASGAGCLSKTASRYYAKEGIELKEDDIKAGKDKATGMYKLVEDYLLANPNVYA